MTKDVEKIIQQNPKLGELDVFNYPGFVKGFNEIMNCKKSKNHLTGENLYYIHSSFGFDLEFMEQLAEIEGMTVDRVGFEQKLNQLKQDFRDKQGSAEMFTALENLLTTATKNDIKYDYSFDSVHQIYQLEPVKSRILSIVDNTGCKTSTGDVSSSTAKVILDKSPFYYESGGQESDCGFISKNGKIFKLTALSSRKNCVLHEVELSKGEQLRVGDVVELEVNAEKRTATTRNHSATHLLNSAIRQVTRYPIFQKSSLVTSDHLKIELSCLGPKLNYQNLKDIENLIQEQIKTRPLERKIRLLNSQDLQNESDVVMVPGEVYPDEGIRLVTFGDFSKELCCGTHVLNTKELLEFTFLSMRSTGRNSYLFSATSGPQAVNAIELGAQLANQLEIVNQSVTAENAIEALNNLRDVSIVLNHSNLPVSFLKKLECQSLSSEIKEKVRQFSKGILDVEMKSVVENAGDSAVVHFLNCSEVLKSVSLEKATKYFKDRPVIIISYTDNMVKARCCVPSHLVTESFNAELWLNEIAKIFKAQIAPPKGQNAIETCLMKEKFVSPSKFDGLLAAAIELGNEFVPPEH